MHGFLYFLSEPLSRMPFMGMRFNFLLSIERQRNAAEEKEI
jgi:hypothetical protein